MKEDVEEAETVKVEDAEIAMIDHMYETETETDKEKYNYKCAFFQKMFPEKADIMKHVQLCEFEGIEESEAEGIGQETSSSPYCQNLFSNSGGVMKQKEEHRFFFLLRAYCFFMTK